MIKRFIASKGTVWEAEDRGPAHSYEEEFVLYPDHAAEIAKFKEAEQLFCEQMKEVLTAGRMLCLHGDSEKRGGWLAVMDRYSHYLEDK